MRSHFRISSGAAKACAVTGATAIMAGICSAQIAADYATDPAYAGGWSAGQNGGYGFGAWSFNGTDPTPAGQYQGISSSSALGTSWTLLSHSTSSGLANAGRAINGGLQPGQTFETVIQNPTTTAGPHTVPPDDRLLDPLHPHRRPPRRRRPPLAAVPARPAGALPGCPTDRHHPHRPRRQPPVLLLAPPPTGTRHLTAPPETTVARARPSAA